jgi:hypothetical protein
VYSAFFMALSTLTIDALDISVAHRNAAAPAPGCTCFFVVPWVYCRKNCGERSISFLANLDYLGSEVFHI